MDLNIKCKSLGKINDKIFRITMDFTLDCGREAIREKKKSQSSQNLSIVNVLLGKCYEIV